MNNYSARRRVSRPLLLILFLTWQLALPSTASAISREIARGRSICDITETACLDGTITWYLNRKMITIEGRMKRKISPGKMVYRFSGYLATGEQVFHAHKFTIRGKRGEIIDERLKPPYSNQTIWSLNRVTYIPLSLIHI